MAIPAIILAQVLDPLRIILLGAAFGLAMLATNKWTGWFALAIAVLALAVVYPLLMGQRGDEAGMAAMVGVLSNALLVMVFMLIRSAWRRF